MIFSIKYKIGYDPIMRELLAPEKNETSIQMAYLLKNYTNNMVYTLIMYLAIILYLVMAYCLFTEWLHFFLQDEQMNLEQRLFSSVILGIASILWIIVVPFAYLELLKFNKKHKKVIDLLINHSKIKIYED